MSDDNNNVTSLKGDKLSNASLEAKALEEFPKILSSTTLNSIMINVLTKVVLIDMDLKTTNPEAYYGAKSKLRDYITTIEKDLAELRGHMAKM